MPVSRRGRPLASRPVRQGLQRPPAQCWSLIITATQGKAQASAAEALDHWIAGATYKEIAEQLGYNQQGNAHRAVQPAYDVWVPNWSSTSCDLGIFVYQPAEQIATSKAKLGWRRRWW
jgi:hypothetical protein